MTVSGDTASRSSETPILGSVVGSSCNNFPVGADCIPTDGPGHSTGAIHFAADGTMFVTAGDGAHWNTVVDDALRAQNLDLLAGKVLHVTRTGAGISSNPFWNGDPPRTARRCGRTASGTRTGSAFGRATACRSSAMSGGASGRRSTRSRRGLGWPCYQGPEASGYQNKPCARP